MKTISYFSLDSDHLQIFFMDALDTSEEQEVAFYQRLLRVYEEADATALVMWAETSLIHQTILLLELQNETT